MQTIRQWLAAMHLERYAETFEANDVDLDVLPLLSDSELARLGVSLGHRKRIAMSLRPGKSVRRAHEADQENSRIPPLMAEGERRQVTVLFCDLVGSTALSNRLDPEEYRTVLSRYHETCIAAVQRFEGFVAQIQGDGVLAYFGYPLAHENEAERAIRSAMAIVDALAELDVGLDHRLQVRVGIATGLVVVSHILAPEKSAVGETPNLAQRLHTLASPGEVITTEHTRVLTRGAFDYENRGVHGLKGILEPVQAWRVLGPGSASSRFDAATGGRLTPMVGRDRELGMLVDRWELARSGKGQVVLLQGEPGIGKSRMLGAFRERLGHGSEVALQYQCSPFHVDSACYPVMEHLQHAMRFERNDGVDERLRKVEQHLIQELGRSRHDCHLLSLLLSLPCLDRYGKLALSPQRKKDETLSLLADIVVTIAFRQRRVILFEDVHWADPTSIELLDALVIRAASTPLMILMTYRPEFEPSWLDHPHVCRIVLGRLRPNDAASMVARVAKDRPLPTELIDRIVEKTDGVPLFLEELTRAVIEVSNFAAIDGRYEYTGSSDRLRIPASLHDLLTARLDRLMPLKEVAQIGAVFGREFSYELVSAVSSMSPAEIDHALDKLVESGLVFQRGKVPNAYYTFKHALVQDAAYDSLLKTQRQALHLRAAEAIRERFASKEITEPEVFAHHYSEAGEWQAAVPLWQKAGELAQRRVALREAIRHFERGLAAVASLPKARERDGSELKLRALLGMAWVELHGYTHPAVVANLQPALELDAALVDDTYLVRVLWGLWVYTLCAGRVEESLAWASRLLATAEARDSEVMRIAGHWTACNSHYFLGNAMQCVQHADEILRRYDFDRDKGIADLINHDPKTIALAYKAGAEWRLGFPDRAAASARAAVDHSSVLGHAFDYCWVRAFLSHTLLVESGDTELMSSLLDEAERLANEQSLLFFQVVYCPLSRGYWLLRLGSFEAAEHMLREVMVEWKAAGMEIHLPSILTRIAECRLNLGDPPEASRLLDEALVQVERPGWRELGALSDILRVQGSAFLAMRQTERAEAAFRRAIDVARAQGTVAWELRAAIVLARMLVEQRRIDEMLALLCPFLGGVAEEEARDDLGEAFALVSASRAGTAQHPHLRVISSN
jgi:class 3 adenylate cyclase/tetratricopeptide (TPR) repeat protein